MKMTVSNTNFHRVYPKINLRYSLFTSDYFYEPLLKKKILSEISEIFYLIDLVVKLTKLTNKVENFNLFKSRRKN